MKKINMCETKNVESEAICKCIAFAREQDLQNMPNGKYGILGNKIYAVMSEYHTAPSSERQWEAHREYIDLQVIIRGEEIVEVATLSNMICKEYITEQDFLPCEGQAEQKVTLQSGIGLLLFPEDAHKPCVAKEGSQFVKKIVFKIHCSCLQECCK